MNDPVIRDPRAVTIKRALISVSDKNNVLPFAQALQTYGVEILSTGGTAKMLKEAGLDVTDVSCVTGFPEIMNGRVKTLHPKIHGGLLGRGDDEGHLQAMDENGIAPIDMLVVNLYPFVETVKGGQGFEACIENIDIGGPAMIRAAAKNHDFVTVITDPQDYDRVLSDMKTHEGGVSHKTRKTLAAAAFALTATYDSNIASWFTTQVNDDAGYPRRVSFSGNRAQVLRYGENPHQSAALYTVDDYVRAGAATAQIVQGKALSYNNLNDTDAAFELVAEFDDPAVAIIKHANPCGVAQADTILKAYEQALLCDPVSAFGGIIATNRELDADTARAMIKKFVEVVIAPSATQGALEVLSQKSKIRVLLTGTMPDRMQSRRIVKPIAAGFLLQDADIGQISADTLKVVSDRAPTEKELADMMFAFRVAKHVKSNAIVYAKDQATVGIGAGQMSRIDSARIAALKAQDAADSAGLDEALTKGSVVASDAFFPFADGLIAASEAGVTAVIQPGGSIRDDEVIEAANARGLAMVFTGQRHFRH